jgi:hypothetical protein
VLTILEPIGYSLLTFSIPHLLFDAASTFHFLRHLSQACRRHADHVIPDGIVRNCSILALTTATRIIPLAIPGSYTIGDA